MPQIVAPHDLFWPLVTRVLTLVTNSQKPHSFAKASRINSGVPSSAGQFATSVSNHVTSRQVAAEQHSTITLARRVSCDEVTVSEAKST